MGVFDKQRYDREPRRTCGSAGGDGQHKQGTGPGNDISPLRRSEGKDDEGAPHAMRDAKKENQGPVLGYYFWDIAK